MIVKCKHDKFNCDECKWINGYHVSHEFPEYNAPKTKGPVKTTVLKPQTNFYPKGKKKS